MGAVREVSFDLPFAPSLNRYYRHVGPRVLISREGRLYRRMVVSRLGGLFEKFSEAVSLSLDCYPPDRRRRDVDNILKCLLDSLVGAGVIEDDSLIKRLHVEMREPIPEGLIHVHVATIPDRGG